MDTGFLIRTFFTDICLYPIREGSVAPEFVGPSDDLVHLVRF